MFAKEYFSIPLFIGLVIALSLVSIAGEVNSEPETVITLYQSGPSLVVELEETSLAEGINDLTRSLPDSVVPRTIFATSTEASLRSAKLRPAVNSEGSLLEELVGKVVEVTKVGEPGSTVEGTLVEVFGGKPLLKTSDGDMRFINNPGDYRFSGLSGEVLDTSLRLKLVAEAATETELTLGYQVSDLNWSPQYAGFLDEEKEFLELQGIAHIENGTGWDFKEVRLNLLAGEPKREATGEKYFMAARALNQPEPESPEEVFEYYSYRVDFPVDLATGEVTQVKFLDRDSVDYRKYYLFEPYSSSAVRTMIELNNTEEKGLGLPVASGTIRIYESTAEKTFLGSDSLPNLPVGSDTKLELGDAFDLKGDRKRISHEKTAERVWKDQIEITVENKKDEPVPVLVKERLPGDWEILKSSHDYEKVESRVIQFEETVDAEGSVEITYLVQYEL